MQTGIVGSGITAVYQGMKYNAQVVRVVTSTRLLVSSVDDNGVQISFVTNLVQNDGFQTAGIQDGYGVINVSCFGLSFNVASISGTSITTTSGNVVDLSQVIFPSGSNVGPLEASITTDVAPTPANATTTSGSLTLNYTGAKSTISFFII